MEGEAGNLQAVRCKKLWSGRRTSLMVMLSAIYLLFPATLKHNNMVFIYNPTQMLISTSNPQRQVMAQAEDL
jgi:hypothetical protein